MRLHRFIGSFNTGKDRLAVADAELVSQWKNVLRLTSGDHVILCDGLGTEAEAVIERISKSEAEVLILSRTQPEREAHKKASLFCALLKRENFELATQKAVELGVSRIVPILTERTIKTGFNRERLERIIREAAEQSGRTVLPELAEPVPFAKAIQAADPKTTAFLDLSGSPAEAGDFKNISAAFVGPEGGFSEGEAALARAKGLHIHSLGPRTMRGETAAIVASYLIAQ